MGSFVLVWGDIAMPPGAVEKWTASKIDLKTWSDAKAPFAGKARAKRVSALLEGWANWNPTAGDDDDVRAEVLTIDAGEASIKVRGRIDEEMFLEMAPMLAGLLRSTAAFGGKGDVTFDAWAMRIVIADEKSSFVKPDAAALDRASDRAAIAEIPAVIVKAPAPAKADPSHAEAEARSRVLAAVDAAEKKEPFAIRGASTSFNHGLRLAPNQMEWPTGVLLQCLGTVAPNVIEPLARDFLACATDVNQRQRALGALGMASTEAAVDTLIETMLSPVPKNGAFKSDHLGANWGLRATKFGGIAQKIDAAIARFETLPTRDARVAAMFQDIRKIHAK